MFAKLLFLLLLTNTFSAIAFQQKYPNPTPPATGGAKNISADNARVSSIRGAKSICANFS